MKIRRFAAFIAVFASLAFASAPADSHGSAGGTQMGSGHSGGGHSRGANGQFAHHGGFRHDGRFVHGGHRSLFFVAGGFWYPWYAYPYPVYTNAWYYCPSAAAYYPAVTYCPEGWVLVGPSAPPL
jgi:hypothetical protein